MNVERVIVCNQFEDLMDILEFVDFLAGFGLVTSPDMVWDVSARL